MKKILTGALTLTAGLGALMAGAASTAQASSTSTQVTRYTTTLTNVRQAASTASSRVDTIKAGSTVTGTLLANGWIQIATPTADAGKYISSSVLTTTKPCASSAIGQTSSGTVMTGWVASSDHSINVRSGPGFNYGIVGCIAGEAKVSGTVSSDWIKVPGGFINSGLIETTNANIFALNGYVPTSALCAVPLAYNTPDPVSPSYTKSTVRYLNCQAVKALNALEASYLAFFGHYALIDLTYRSHAEEVYWRDARPEAASPVGTSNHGWGLAIDFREIDDANGNEIHSGEFYWGQPGYNWLAANASKYGFVGDPVTKGTADESYHWNFAG